MDTHPHTISVLGALALTLLAGIARAESPAAATPTAPQAEAKAEGPTPAEKKAGYSLPWLLRPAIAPNIVRVDAALAFHTGGATQVPVLTAGGKPIDSLPDLGFYLRGAVVHFAPDAPGTAATALSNPLPFALYTPEIGTGLRLSLFGGVALPVGAGGGNTPAADKRAAVGAGIPARESMDNALFATNYATPTAGVGIARIMDGLTLQADVGVLYLIRAKGADVDKDSSRVNFVSGLHAGYLVMPWLTVSVEMHYQRWISTPAAVDAKPAAREQATAGGGVRFNVPVSRTTLLRPGIAYFMPIDDPMADAKYKIVQVDLPVAF